MLWFTMNTFPKKQKGWKDEVSLRNSRISSLQIPVRVAPQHCVTKDCFVLHISLYALRTSLKSGTNANKPFHIFSLKTFSLQSFHPASPCDTHQGYNHQETLRRSIFCLIQNYECVQNPALRTNLTIPCSQTDPVLSSPLLPMTLLHLCVLFGKVLTPLYFCLKTSVCCLSLVWKLFKVETAYVRIVLHSQYQKWPRDVCSFDTHFSAI